MLLKTTCILHAWAGSSHSLHVRKCKVQLDEADVSTVTSRRGRLRCQANKSKKRCGEGST